MSHPNLLDASDTVLVVIDMQDSFMKAIYEPDRVISNTIRLIEAAKLFCIPIIVTVQNEERLGGCSPEVAAALPEPAWINKMPFSCFGADAFREQLERVKRRQALLCGIETHVCVNQTAHDFLSRAYQTHVAAVSSRAPGNWKTGIEKMRDSGCIVTSTEMAIFELLRDASSEHFRSVLKLVK